MAFVENVSKRADIPLRGTTCWSGLAHRGPRTRRGPPTELSSCRGDFSFATRQERRSEASAVLPRRFCYARLLCSSGLLVRSTLGSIEPRDDGETDSCTRNRARRWRGKAAGAIDPRSGKTCSFIWLLLSFGGLRPQQLGQRWVSAHRRVDAVQESQSGSTPRSNLAHVTALR